MTPEPEPDTEMTPFDWAILLILLVVCTGVWGLAFYGLYCLVK